MFKSFGVDFYHLEGAYHYNKGITHRFFGQAHTLVKIRNPVTAMKDGSKMITGPIWKMMKVGEMRRLLRKKDQQNPEFSSCSACHR